MRRRFVSRSLGLIAALMTLAAVLLQLGYWWLFETYRLPPISQAGFFFGMTLFGVLAVLQAVLAFQPSTTRRAIAMTAVAGGLAIQGAIGSAAGSQPAVALLYAGAIGLAAGIVGISEGQRRLLAVIGGVLGSLIVAVSIDVLIRSVSRAFA